MNCKMSEERKQKQKLIYTSLNIDNKDFSDDDGKDLVRLNSLFYNGDVKLIENFVYYYSIDKRGMEKTKDAFLLQLIEILRYVRSVVSHELI